MSRPLLPDYIVIGAAKAGTTALAHFLGQHPDLFMTDPKEPDYFSNNGVTWEEYQQLFVPGEGAKLRGEASTTYSRHPCFGDVVGAIKATVPDVKLIYIIRHPIRRIESHFAMRLRRGQASGTVEEAVERKEEYLVTSLYGKQASLYVDAFGRDRLHILRMEDLKSNPSEELAKVYGFLGVDPTFLPPDPNEKKNAAPEVSVRTLQIPRLLRPVRRLIPAKTRLRIKQLLPKRRVDPSILKLSPATVERLEALFREDFATLRTIVGPEMDLYGYA